MIRADSNPVREALFKELRRTNLFARFAHQIHHYLGNTWASSVLVSFYGLKSFLALNVDRQAANGILAVASYANAKNQIQYMASLVGARNVSSVQIDLTLLHIRSILMRIFEILMNMKQCIRVLSLIHSIDARYNFLVSCRVASTIASYARAKHILRDMRPRAVLVSSCSNPEEVGFIAAARAFRIPTIFVSHAYTADFSTNLDFTLSILEGQAALEAYRRKGEVRGRVLLAGLKGESVLLDAGRLAKSNPVIGIFADKTVVWSTFVAVIDDCRKRFHARQILIRWHPSMLERPRLDKILKDQSGILETKRTEALSSVAKQCDWVISSPNSNVHLPVLKLGIPTVAVENLGIYPKPYSDLYGFVANRIIFPPVSSLGDLPMDDVIAFFSGDWPNRFRRYDAAYLQTPEIMDTGIRRALHNSLKE